MYDKLKVFKTELEAVQNPIIRKFAEKIISNLPDYFFETAASSTGKYHPSYALGSGGLVRHTKAAVNTAIDLLNLEHYNTFTTDEKDCIIVALICHDGWKHGNTYNQYTIATHPVVAADNILAMASEDEMVYAKLIADNIKSHMGQWNTDYKTKKEIMPKPKTESEKFTHLCDYLASRKYLTYEFERYYEPRDYETGWVSPLQKRINELINLCKEKIANGADREELYSIIAAKNDGKKNPNTITDINTVNEIIDIVTIIKDK